MEYAPPPSNIPGLIERLIAPSALAADGLASAAADTPPQFGARQAAHAVEGPVLVTWLGRFGSLLRRLDGAAPLKEVISSACDAAAGVLRTKAAAAAAAASASAARAAQEAAERTRASACIAQEHAEAAARELMSVKWAEMQAVAMLTGAKVPDPAAAEVVKAQASVKCAEQLKVGCGIGVLLGAEWLDCLVGVR